MLTKDYKRDFAHELSSHYSIFSTPQTAKATGIFSRKFIFLIVHFKQILYI